MNEFGTDLSRWVTPFGIVALTLVAVWVARWLLRRAARIRHLTVLTEVAPAFANLIYVVGFKLFVDTAPLHPKLSLWLGNAIYVFGILVLLSIVRRAVMMGIEWSAFRATQSTTLQHGFIPLLRNVATLFLFFMGGIMILSHFGYDVMSLLTALGVGSLAVGLAAKDTLSNMISGFTLIIDRNLLPGDRIRLGDQTGEVDEIGLRSTRIRLGNGNTLIVPNAELVNTKIVNLSQPSRSTAVSTTLRFPPAVPAAKIRAACQTALAEHSLAVKDRPSGVSFSGIFETYQAVTVTFWVKDLDQEGSAISELNERVLTRLSGA